MTKRISGVFAPVTTPFVDEEVSIAHLKENFRKYRKTSLDGFLVLGSNGENKSLTEGEKMKIVEVALKEKAEHQVIMTGTGHESTRETISFSQKVASLGVDYVSILTPSYFKKGLTDEALMGYYTDVAEALSIPVLIYNAPGFTGITISPKVIETLSRHENIAGMKDTSPAGIASYIEVSGGSFDVLAGTINTFFIGLSLGAKGGVVSLANAFPEPCCALYKRYIDGDLKGAREIHSKLFRLNQSVSGAGGVAGVKYAMEVAGYHGDLPRLPLLPLEDPAKKRVSNAIAEAGLS